MLAGLSLISENPVRLCKLVERGSPLVAPGLIAFSLCEWRMARACAVQLRRHDSLILDPSPTAQPIYGDAHPA